MSSRSPVRHQPRPRGVASAQARLEERRRSAVLSRIRMWAAVVAVGAVVLGAVWVVGYSPLLAARTVSVEGVTGQRATEIESLAKGSVGMPLARVDVAGIARDIRQRPEVADVEVSRSWPATIALDVTLRTPVLVLRNTKGQLEVVDREGVRFATVASQPAGVPLISATTAGGLTSDAMKTAVAVMTALPSDLEQRVSNVKMSSADNVTFVVGKTTVVWGGASEGALKVKIVRSLLAQQPKTIDVSAPMNPVTT